ncbi:MAG TPA: class I SAM-dependent methyltransferase [Thermoanaerobaculia bacterium]|jgi:2-polyprenyl-3-methyl-5-hydroxy-6-metoxy-1,4-benzoquinol methylase|nr:class I SAM-dependent methyltransferase [Thermoanaerobaculia bacterium]
MQPIRETTGAGEDLSHLYDEMEAGYYDRAFHRGRGVQWFWQLHRLRLVHESLPPGATRVIDVGCGPGTFLGNFLGPETSGLGVDLARPQIEYAQRRYGRAGLEFRQGDVTRFEHEKPFDVAVSIEVIEHLPRERTGDFLATLARLVRPGGTVILVTPNYASAWPLTEWLISKMGPVDYLAQHINPFTKRRLVQEVTDAGLAVEKCRTFFIGAPFVAAVSAPVAERLVAWESALLPGLGSELLLVARKPPSEP